MTAKVSASKAKEIRDPWPDDPHAICRRFFDEVDTIANPNPRVGSSYFIKHVAEDAARSYVPMDALLDVAKERGLPMERCEHGSPNFWMPICKRSLQRFIDRYKLMYTI